MAITVSGTSITFNDATTQTTAYTGSAPAPTTAQVLSAYAGAAFSDVGTYALVYVTRTAGTSANFVAGTNYASSSSNFSLNAGTFYQLSGCSAPYTVGMYYNFTGSTLPGTWKNVSGTTYTPLVSGGFLMVIMLRVA